MNLYQIDLHRYRGWVTGKSKSQAVYKFLREIENIDYGHQVRDLLFLDCIRHTEDYIKCLGHVNRNRNLAKRGLKNAL